MGVRALWAALSLEEWSEELARMGVRAVMAALSLKDIVSVR